MESSNATAPGASSSRGASISTNSSSRSFGTAISNTSNPSGTHLQLIPKEWSISSLSTAGASSPNLDLSVIDRLRAEIEKESQPNTTPFDKKDAVYTLVKKIHRGCQDQSPWWQFFHVYAEGSIKPPEHEEGTIYACCNMCGKNINVTNGIAGLITHIRARHDNECLKFVADEKGGHKRSADGRDIRDLFKHSKAPKMLSNTEKREHVKHQTARWLAMDILPLTTVESKRYRQHIESIDSKMKPFTAVSMKNTLRSLEDKIRDAIVERVTGSWMALTTDHWTSRGKDSYTGMTAHWVDEKFELQNRVLGCWLHEGDSESQTLQDDFLEELFKKCKFQTANIVAVVSDTTSNMNKFGTLLEKLDIPHIEHILHGSCVAAHGQECLP